MSEYTPAAEPRWEDSPDYPHRIEDHVKVYLHLEDPEAGPGGARWVVSSATVDGYPLDGVEDGPYCDYEGHPYGARPDWDRQHEAGAKVDLPTAEELLPLLAAALGARVVYPEANRSMQVRVGEVMADFTAWKEQRAALAAEEAHGYVTSASAWQHSDDQVRGLADRAVALLAELTGQPISPDEDPPATAASGVALMRSALQESNPPSTTPPESPSGPGPSSGPSR